MENTMINPALVAAIQRLDTQHREAAMRCREQFSGWEKQGMLAGLERRFYGEVGNLPGVEDIVNFEETPSYVDAGIIVWEMYCRGLLEDTLSMIRS